MKILTLLCIAILISCLVIIRLIRRQPGQIAFVPMELEIEDPDGIIVEPADLEDSYEFKKEKFWYPERVH